MNDNWKAYDEGVKTEIISEDSTLIASVYTDNPEGPKNVRLIAASNRLFIAAKRMVDSSCNCELGYVCEMCELRNVIEEIEREPNSHDTFEYDGVG